MNLSPFLVGAGMYFAFFAIDRIIFYANETNAIGAGVLWGLLGFTFVKILEVNHQAIQRKK